LEGDDKNVPKHNAEADRQVDLSRRHRREDGERQQAMIALLSIRALAFASVGKVSGKSAENKMMSTTAMIGRPWRLCWEPRRSRGLNLGSTWRCSRRSPNVAVPSF
jgi:hypothetical protein